MTDRSQRKLSQPKIIILTIIFVLIGGVLHTSFAAPNPSLSGDLNNDNTVNSTDLSILVSDYNTSNAAADINSNGHVDIIDLSILLSHFGQSIAIPLISGPWYASTSSFNIPIPAGTAIRSNSASLITAMQNTYCAGATGCIVPGDFFSTPSIWIAHNSTPFVTVEINYPTTCHQSIVQVPIPSGAVVSHSGDPEPVMAVLQADTGEEWDFYKVTAPGVTPVNSTGPQNCPADSNWQAVIVAHHNPGWIGSGSESSTRASGTLSGAGLIRPRDWSQPTGSTWDHALAFAYTGTLGNSHVLPATENDGTSCTDTNTCLPEGARIQLDPTVNCSTWPSLQDSAYGGASAEFIRQMCRTLQKYGMIIVDSGAGLIAENSVSAQSTNIDADPPHSGTTAPWNTSPNIQYLPKDLYPKLRVIDWTQWTGQ